MKTKDFDYPLDESLIAYEPLPERSASRLLCLDKQSGELQHQHFYDLPDFLKAGDLLVFNDTKVMKARLQGQKLTGGKIEILVERLLGDTIALAHVRGGKGQTELIVAGEHNCNIIGREGALFKLQSTEPWTHIMQEHGQMPLPPYIKRDTKDSDTDRYQTVYADDEKQASVAAPTAGLHFDEGTLDKLKAKGVKIASVTLHVGAGTFQPLRTDDEEDPRNHQMHSEYIEVSQSTCDAIAETKAAGGRVIAVGTTSVRSLESANGKPYRGETDIFISRGYIFNTVDAMITNFHLPRTTLLMLVSAFAGRENILKAYAEAKEKKYRFFSYGDAMFLS